MNDPQQPRPSASDVAYDYDRIADEYARRLYAELDAKPFDRTILDRFAALVGNGRVCEVGCGPGHVSRYLRDRGCDVFGIDLSPRMVELAAELNPEIEFQVGDLRALDLADSTLPASSPSTRSSIFAPTTSLLPSSSYGASCGRAAEFYSLSTKEPRIAGRVRCGVSGSTSSSPSSLTTS